MNDTAMNQLLRQNTAVETAPLQQETILFHPRLNRFCVLNRTSSFIWERLRSPISPEQIADELSATFNGVTPAEALKDVTQALSTLKELDLVVVHNSEGLA
jgi:hypothetical protein